VPIVSPSAGSSPSASATPAPTFKTPLTGDVKPRDPDEK
jgi:hypothetical protein